MSIVLSVGKSINALLQQASAALAISVPVSREGETASNPAGGYITWDWTEELTEEQLSEDRPKIWYPKFAVGCWASSVDRRNVIEGAVLDIVTPKQPTGRRMPFSGRSLDIWYHCIHHTGSDLISGAKEGQTGPEVPGISLTFNAVVEYKPVEEP